jgi:hypothetical protein
VIVNLFINFTLLFTRYCIAGLDEDLERVLHCDSIWLHALQYQGEYWRFRTRLPSWAHGMTSRSSSEGGAGEDEFYGVEFTATAAAYAAATASTASTTAGIHAAVDLKTSK